MQAEVKDAYWALFDTEEPKTEPQPGPKLVELAGNRKTEMASRYGATYPAAMKCLLADRESLTAYLRFPAEQQHRVRHSNFNRTHLRRDSPPHQGHRAAPRRDQLPHPSPGRPGPRLPRPARPDHDQHGLRLLQDLRRSVLEPPRQPRPRTAAAARDDNRPENVSATA
jgi:putative transposase